MSNIASKELLSAIENYEQYIARKGNCEQAVDAYVEACKTAFLAEKDIQYGLIISERCKGLIHDLIHIGTEGGDFKFLEEWSQKNKQEVKLINQYYEILKLEAEHNFESFMIYMEKNRPYKKRFYLPRRCTQKVVADDLQELETGNLKVYGLSEPSRVGKTTIILMFLSWVGLRKPWSHNAYGGHSGQLAKRAFKGLDNLVETPEYTYAELFQFVHPELKKVIESKSSDPAEFIINLGEQDEFATFTFRGIDATWTGAVDVSFDGYLCVDDMIRDREHSLSPSRVENTYQEYQNKMLDRMNDGAKKLLIGTRWCPLDVLGREETVNLDNKYARFRKIPALNENDESNFLYEYKGFSAQYYIDMRERLDKAEWMAKFQQQPFVREGLTFPIEQLRRFEGNVPNGKCKTWAALDPAFGRGDSLSMPICKDFGDKEKYIVDWVHDKRTIAFTIPLVADKIQEHMVTELKIEKNRGGDLFAEKLQEELDARGIRHCHITLENAPVKMSKEDKISGYSDFIKRYFLFLILKKWTEDDDYEYHASNQYRKAIDEMTMFSAEGKNPFDDAADAITQLAMMFENRTSNRAKIIASPI